MSFISWPEIESFYAVRKSVEKYPQILGGNSTISYRAKVKLHGTNGAVQIRGNTVMAQSRTTMLGTGADNAGFAAWVESMADRFREAFAGKPPMILFGEWCGPGIMKGVAVNQIPNKVFAVFAAAEIPVEDDSFFIVEPEELLKLVAGLPDVHVLPWFGSIVDIPLLEQAEVVQPLLDKINSDVAELEACDPWVKATFGVEGTGEGLVFYPLGQNRKRFSDLCFKAKGEKHKVVAKAAPVQIDPAVADGIDQFVSMVLTEARLEQGARVAACGELTFDKRLIGPFLGWIGKDVEKETQHELQASKLTWKQVQKDVTAKAREWYMTRAERL
jgi:hypothetical protein